MAPRNAKGTTPENMAHRITRIPLGLYKHYKGGVYDVLHVGLLEKTLEEVVVYKQTAPSAIVFVRPLAEFEEEVVSESNEILKRFTKLP